MMNEPGKSDRPAVPEKSPNNAGPPARGGDGGKGSGQRESATGDSVRLQLGASTNRDAEKTKSRFSFS
jgi:hypothetical protein